MSKQKFITVFGLFLILFSGLGEQVGSCQIILSQNINQKSDDSLSQSTPCNRAILDGKYDEAIPLCTQEIALSPKTAEGYNTRGVAHYLKQNYDAAIADYSKAISLDPKGKPNFYTNRGMAYAGKGLFDPAIIDFDQAIAMDPKDFLAYSGRGRAYAGKGDLDRAIAEYTRSLGLDPFPHKSGITYVDRGDAYLAKEKYELALLDYQNALKSFPEDPYTFSRIGRSLYSLERYGEASRIFQQGLEKAKDENQKADLNYELAMSYAALGEYSKAAILMGERKSFGVEISKVFNGIKVERVHKGAPADLGGIKAKDIMTDFNGEKLAAMDLKQFIDTILEKPKFGSKVKVIILRDGTSLEKSIVAGIPANLPILAREEEARMPAASPGPLVQIRKVEIRPGAVPPGGRFDLVVEYFVSDSSLKQEQLPVQFSFSILQGEKTLYGSTPLEIMSSNSQNTIRTEPLNASNRRGTYLLKVSLTYKKVAAEKSVELRVE
ncbi:MAG: tetratricopeptide repeat protein [Deltaproteobacteria bacterium]|nr:tetratricopeptide repeat protein [Deltaproteobacteria bacterium]